MSAASAAKEFPIRVSVRCRPRNQAEIDANSPLSVEVSPSASQIITKVKMAGKLDSRAYTFDQVYDSSASQNDVYMGVVAPVLEEVLQGFNCTVFAYGQTGTGKTHTMEGARPDKRYTSFMDDPGAGIIPRTLHHLFEKLGATGFEFSVRVSFLEIYNEELFDLLSPGEDQSRLRLFEDTARKGSVVIQGLEEIMVHNKDEVYDIMTKGAEKRRTSATLMNKQSSRSHSVFMITVHQKECPVAGEEIIKTGKLYLVDLAGSENIGRSGAMKDRAREAGNINQSLLTLGRVIAKLVERAPHIPYRESKLTRLLQDSLGGRTLTSIIATISPAMVNLEETMSTLDYASRAKSIVNRPEANQKLTKKALIKEYTDEIERLKRDLLANREKNGIYVTEERYEEMEREREALKIAATEASARMEVLDAEVKKHLALFEDATAQLQAVEAARVALSAELDTVSTSLRDTEANLAVTEFQLVAHRHGISQLGAQATEVIAAADLAVAHVDLMHTKAARLTATHIHNHAATSSTGSVITAGLSAAVKDLTMFSDAQHARHVAISAALSALAQSSVAHASATQRAFTTLLAGVQTRKTEAQTELGQSTETLVSWGATFPAVAMASAQKEVVDSAFQTSVLLPGATAFADLAQMAATHAADSAALWTCLQTQLEEAQKQLQSFTQAHAKVLADAAESVAKHAAEQEARFADEHASLRDAARVQAENAAGTGAALIAQLAALVQGHLATTQEGSAKLFVRALESTQAHAARESDFAAQHSALLAQSASTLSENAVSTTSMMENAMAIGANNAARLSSQLQNVGSRATEAKEALALGVAAAADVALATAKDLANQAVSVTTAAVASSRLCENSLDLLVRSAGEEQEQLVAASQGFHLKHEAAVEGIKDSVAGLADAHTSASELQQRQLESLAGAMEDLLQSQLRDDSPSGMTPARQVYEFPRDLYRVRTASELRARHAEGLAPHTPLATDSQPATERDDAPAPPLSFPVAELEELAVSVSSGEKLAEKPAATKPKSALPSRPTSRPLANVNH